MPDLTPERIAEIRVMLEDGIAVYCTREETLEMLASVKSIPKLRKVLDVAKRLESRLSWFLAEEGGCDHSVGICACADIGLTEEARAAIADAEREGA